MQDVGPHLGARCLDPLLDLVEVVVDDLGPTRRARAEPSLLSCRDVVGDGARRAVRQLGGIPVALGQIECFENFHGFLVRLHVLLLGNWVLGHTQHTGEERPGGGSTGRRSINEAELMAASARFSCPSARGYLAVSVQDLMAADTRRAQSPAVETVDPNFTRDSAAPAI